MRAGELVLSKVWPEDFFESEGLPLHSGSAWVKAGLCPFHDDTNEGSFYVHAEEGAFNCFACGTKGSNIIEFRMQKEGTDFMEALNSIKEEWRLV